MFYFGNTYKTRASKEAKFNIQKVISEQAKFLLASLDYCEKDN